MFSLPGNNFASSTKKNDIAYCAQDQFENKDSCPGDSGGPLQTYSGTVKLVGVISFGVGHCGNGNPGILKNLLKNLPNEKWPEIIRKFVFHI